MMKPEKTLKKVKQQRRCVKMNALQSAFQKTYIKAHENMIVERAPEHDITNLWLGLLHRVKDIRTTLVDDFISVAEGSALGIIVTMLAQLYGAWGERGAQSTQVPRSTSPHGLLNLSIDVAGLSLSSRKSIFMLSSPHSAGFLSILCA